MKKIYKPIAGFFILLTSAFNAYSQPTLTGANSNPQPGDSYTILSAGLPPANVATATGAGYTWDFHAYPGGLLDTYTYINAATTPWIGFFPGATVSLYFSSSNYYNYYMGTASEYSYMGGSSGTAGNVYTNPYKFQVYPFTYQDAFLDTFYTNGTWTAYSTHTADGYGSVMLPFGTVTNLLRIHEYTVIYYPTDTTYENFYYWMKPGVHWTVCQYGEQHTSSQTLNTFYYYLDPLSLGVNELTENDKEIHCYPNPFRSDLTVDIQKQNFKEAALTIKNTLGQTVFSEQVNNLAGNYPKTIDLRELTKGIYFLEIVADGERSVRKVVKE